MCAERRHAGPPTPAFRVTRLSSGAGTPPWMIAVFAHNEAGRIRFALESIATAADATGVEVVVLANGCTDATVSEVRAAASLVPNLTLVEIDIADKANAWNTYIHEVFSSAPDREFEIHFFMDGDVTLGPHALSLLAVALDDVPSAKAAGGMPATGRDRDAWRQRMVANGMLAGNLYALRAGFVDRLREQGVRMPVGLIGEDFLVSWLVASQIGRRDGLDQSTQCVFRSDALFSFRSLSPWRWRDYRTYLRRKWRYTCRALQHQMLILHLIQYGLGAMPRDVEALYREAPLPSRLAWVGLDTPLRTLAMLRIRSVRSNAAKSRRAGRVA